LHNESVESEHLSLKTPVILRLRCIVYLSNLTGNQKKGYLLSSLSLEEAFAIPQQQITSFMEMDRPPALNPDPNLSAFSSVSTQFLQHFKLIVATTPKLREEVYRIRYKVYCQELKYESEEKFPNGMEQDIYDQRSIHCLLKHRHSGLYAGCVRLILAEPHSSTLNLPIEKIYGCSLRSYNLSDSAAMGEVSRLAVVSEFRKRQEEGQTMSIMSTPGINFTEDERRCFPLIALGLYLSATSVALEVGLNNVFTLMEPRLARHLRRFGIKFVQVGDLFEFRGQRGLFQISRSAVLSSINPSTQELFQTLSSDVNKSLTHFIPHLIHRRAA